ncbi:MAG: type I glyceraldehyde-3-phosphate dehydrogenase [Candidatus Pacearchaeota archaeon]
MRIAINGFGRIGRTILRVLLKNNERDLNVVAINDLTDAKTLAHLFKYDTVYRTLENFVSSEENFLLIDDKRIRIFSEKDPLNLPWKDLNIDVVIESTGVFRSKEQCEMHIKAGAKKVILTAPAKGDVDITIVKGVNEHLYNHQIHHIISNASCTTNCLLPLLKVLDDNFKVIKGFMTTVHSYTADQKLVDSPHKDLRRARHAALNIVPTTTGASKAVSDVLPHLKGKIDGMALRVPTADVSITDLVCEVEKETSVEYVNWLMKSVSEHELKGVVQYLDFPAVSSDLIGNSHSCIFDPEYTRVNGRLVKVLAWYDNEWGYCCRVVDLLKIIQKNF